MKRAIDMLCKPSNEIEKKKSSSEIVRQALIEYIENRRVQYKEGNHEKSTK